MADTPDSASFASRQRLLLALLIPLAAFALQWTFWDAIRLCVWFLFFPAVFFSSRIGGLVDGLLATLLSAAIVAVFFIQPQAGFLLNKPISSISIAIFLGMGVLFSLSHERLRTANEHIRRRLKHSQGWTPSRPSSSPSSATSCASRSRSSWGRWRGSLSAADLDDYISKPVQPEQLEEILALIAPRS